MRNLKKNSNKQNENRFIDTENKWVVARRDGGGIGKIIEGFYFKGTNLQLYDKSVLRM